MTEGEEAVIRCAMSEASLHVLFVCTGNTCRSPMAEGLFRFAAADLDDVEVSSAGIAAYGGDRVSPETLQILNERGVGLEGFRSRMVDEGIIQQATHIFCMTRSHLETLEALYPQACEKLYLVCEFAEIDGEVGRDVPDPIGGGRGAYEQVAACLDQAIAGIIGFLRGTGKGQAG